METEQEVVVTDKVEVTLGSFPGSRLGGRVRGQFVHQGKQMQEKIPAPLLAWFSCSQPVGFRRVLLITLPV